MRLARAVRLRHDAIRGQWLLLAPERGYILQGSALAIVERLQRGARVREIAIELNGSYGEVAAFVEDLIARGLVEA